MLPYLFAFASLLFETDQQTLPFKEQTIDSAVSIGYGIALGDVDGDRKTDILLADKTQIVWYRNGDWKKFIIAENLTEFDNVCIAARDIDGDGKVEVAVGAQWNPGETSDTTKSGSVHFLVRPNDLNKKWGVITLPHEPTVHRMQWVKLNNKFHLVVLPLHGRNNKGGEGAGVRVYAYEFPKNLKVKWKMTLLADDMHMTHNFAVRENSSNTELYIAGKEGVRIYKPGQKQATQGEKMPALVYGAGEIKPGKNSIATIEPMHGNKVVVYAGNNYNQRTVLDSTLKEGHALGVADFLGTGAEQVVAGWRNPDEQNNTGIRLYMRDQTGTSWQWQWLDKNGIACEDIQVADLDGNGKPDIIAAGRATKNLKVYWNQSE